MKSQVCVASSTTLPSKKKGCLMVEESELEVLLAARKADLLRRLVNVARVAPSSVPIRRLTNSGRIAIAMLT